MTDHLKALLQAERVRAAADLRLLERVATAANEAAASDEAVAACLEAVCEHSGYGVGRAWRLTAEGELADTGVRHPASAADCPPSPPALVREAARLGEPCFDGAAGSVDPGHPAAAFPVRVGPRVEAVLAFDGEAPEAPDRPAQASLLTQVGVQVGRVFEREELEAQLRQSQKMEAVGRLAGGVAHDFNNLLTTITGVADLLLPTFEAEDLRRHEIEAIQTAALQAADLTRQLLAFSRRQVLEPRVLDLRALVSDTERILGRTLGEDVSLHARLDASTGRVKADPGQLGQVLMNLAINARDAMPGGGQLTLAVEDVTLGAYEARRVGIAPGAYVCLSVEDTGTGMDEETRSRIFEPFFTTKAQGKGTGLGLSTVYGIVAQSGGRITVDSRPGRGTTFRIYLPRVEAQAEPRRRRRELGPRLGGPETILLVEDGEQVRRLTRRMLEAVGYRVLPAADGPEAIGLAARHDGAVDLLLTDVVMPQMSGAELAEVLVRSRPELKVLFMSGYTAEVIARHGVLEPGVHFLEKPFRVDGLLAKVRAVLDARPRGVPASEARTA